MEWTLATKFQVKLHVQSVPVVVITHDNQKNHALASVFWNEAGENVTPLPTELPWEKVGSTLSSYWNRVCGHPLEEIHLYSLACKAFLKDPQDCKDFDPIKL